MRMSCNGCRILRKGCSDDCIIKPCLDWIKSPDSQANATLFLAKFYGRAGLINLIEAGPLHLGPAIFKSLLYEACGRIVDPISGSVGLLWSGKWEQCQAAVDSVLKGAPITQNPSSSSSLCSTNSSINAPPSLALHHHPSRPPHPPDLKIYDIRHVSKDHTGSDNKTKTSRLKRSWNRRSRGPLAGTNQHHHHHQSTGKVHPPGQFSVSLSQLSREDESIFSVETVEGSLANRTEPRWCSQKKNCEVGLELTLGLPPVVNKLID